MSSKRMLFKEKLKKACTINKSKDFNMHSESEGTRTDSPVPYLTNEEKEFWANNDVFDDSDIEEDTIIQNNKDCNKILDKSQNLNTNLHQEETTKNVEMQKDLILSNNLNEQQLNCTLHSTEDHLENIALNIIQDQIISDNDPLLSSDNGPDSCIATLTNLESVPESPMIALNNTANVSSIAYLLDIDGINSIPPSPLNTVTSSSSLIPINSPQSIETATSSRIYNKKKDKGKGRKVHKDMWKDNIRKTKKNTGKCYLSRDGTRRPARKIKSFCNKCKFGCPKRFTDELRKIIFNRFWGIGNNMRQWDFISKYCQKIPKRRRTSELPSRRLYTITYSLPSGDSLVDAIPVCKVMFLNTLGIGAGMVNTALTKIDGAGIITPDFRGGASNRRLVIDAAMIKSVCDHVNIFQPVESHYVRSRTSKLYLDSSLSYSRMFVLYKEWIVENASNYSNSAKTLRQYRDIVNSNFNLGFHAPRKDQCDVCHVYNNLPKPATDAETKTYRDHIKNKDIAREIKKKYKELSVENSHNTLTTTYDFQKIHGIPHGQTSILYYKRKLSVYNLTFYSLGQKEGICYVWDETTAKKGATEVASCVYNYIKEHSQKGIQFFYFFSDNCGGQNRNRIVFLAYLHAAKNFKVNITHTFLERGHTQNEGDSVHALIERFAKNKMIYSPDDWYNMIRWAKQDNNPYRVIEMQNSDFLDFKKYLVGANWVANEKGEKMFWSQIRQLQVLPNETDRIYYKTDFCSHEYDCIILYTYRQLNTRRRRRDNIADVEGDTSIISNAYSCKFPVPKNKFQDLKYLCDHQIIPVKYHGFYESLVSGGDDEAELTEN